MKKNRKSDIIGKSNKSAGFTFGELFDFFDLNKMEESQTEYGGRRNRKSLNTEIGGRNV